MNLILKFIKDFKCFRNLVDEDLKYLISLINIKFQNLL